MCLRKRRSRQVPTRRIGRFRSVSRGSGQGQFHAIVWGMFNIGGWEMAILAIAGLMFFGPDKLPQIMRQAGKIYRQIQKASSEFQYSISRELDEDKYKKAHRR